MSRILRSLALGTHTVVAALSAAACGSTSDAAPAPATARAQAPDPTATCVEVMTRNRTCTDDYIPALVDARARHDVPAGITAAVKADRAAVIAEALGEWAEDRKDPAITAMCQQLAASGAAPPAEVEAAQACLAQVACGPYVACVMPVFEKRFQR